MIVRRLKKLFEKDELSKIIEGLQNILTDAMKSLPTDELKKIGDSFKS